MKKKIFSKAINKIISDKSDFVSQIPLMSDFREYS